MGRLKLHKENNTTILGIVLSKEDQKNFKELCKTNGSNMRLTLDKYIRNCISKNKIL